MECNIASYALTCFTSRLRYLYCARDISTPRIPGLGREVRAKKKKKNRGAYSSSRTGECLIYRFIERLPMRGTVSDEML